ncbi:hypothetical protein JCM8547_005731 [Rhodosporidiobolus lusitaniae]
MFLVVSLVVGAVVGLLIYMLSVSEPSSPPRASLPGPSVMSSEPRIEQAAEPVSVESGDCKAPVEPRKRPEVPEDIIIKILELLLVDSEYKSSRNCLLACCLVSKACVNLSRPFLQKPRERHILLEFESVWHDAGGRVEFRYHRLTPSSLAQATMEGAKLRQIRSVGFKKARQQTLHCGQQEPATRGVLHTLFQHLTAPISLSLPVIPMGFAYSSHRRDLFPLPTSTMVPDGFDKPFKMAPISTFHSFGLPPLTSLTVTGEIDEDNLDFLFAVFASSLSSVAVTIEGPSDFCANLNLLVSLECLTFLLIEQYFKPSSYRRSPFDKALRATGTAPHTASSFCVVVKPHPRSIRLRARWD